MLADLTGWLLLVVVMIGVLILAAGVAFNASHLIIIGAIVAGAALFGLACQLIWIIRPWRK